MRHHLSRTLTAHRVRSFSFWSSKGCDLNFVCAPDIFPMVPLPVPKTKLIFFKGRFLVCKPICCKGIYFASGWTLNSVSRPPTTGESLLQQHRCGITPEKGTPLPAERWKPMRPPCHPPSRWCPQPVAAARTVAHGTPWNGMSGCPPYWENDAEKQIKRVPGAQKRT